MHGPYSCVSAYNLVAYLHVHTCVQHLGLVRLFDKLFTKKDKPKLVFDKCGSRIGSEKSTAGNKGHVCVPSKKSLLTILFCMVCGYQETGVVIFYVRIYVDECVRFFFLLIPMS